MYVCMYVCMYVRLTSSYAYCVRRYLRILHPGCRCLVLVPNDKGRSYWAHQEGSGTMGRDRAAGEEFVFFQHRVKDCQRGFLVALFDGFQHEKNTRCEGDLHFD